MNVQLSRHSMYFGLIMGAIFSLNFFITTFPSLGYMQYIFLVVIIYLTYKFTVHCRDKVLGGVMSYGASLGYIVQLYLYASMIVTLFKYIFFKFISPDFLSRQLDITMKVWSQTPLASMITPEVYETMQRTMTPLNMSIQSIWINVLYGLILGLVMSAIVKRDKSIFEE